MNGKIQLKALAVGFIPALTRRMTTELDDVKKLMPLLMKSRNKEGWTPEDRAQIMVHLRRLSCVSPWLIVLAMPGSFLILPALAWWLDRRHNERCTVTSAE